MNGFFVIDKPQGFTSFDVIAKMRGILHIKKLGHSGTLDPMATGVLPVFAGEGTRAIPLLPNTRKAYSADVSTGILTDTGDITGEVTARSALRPSKGELCAVLPQFTGEISQTPPMYSAVKVNGQRLYKLARAGQTAEIPTRKVTIYKLELSNYTADGFSLYAECSAGTYIRTLAQDICAAAGALGTLSALRRTQSCGFGLDESVTLDLLSRAFDPWALSRPCEQLFETLPHILLDDRHHTLFMNGVRMEFSRFVSGEWSEGQLFAVYSQDGFSAVAQNQGGLMIKRAPFSAR